MRIPESLAELGKKRIESYAAEGFVYGGGPENPLLMLVGEAPGETEIHNGIPFSGRAGKELMAFLERVGLQREDVYITSAVRSRPYKWREKRERTGEMIQKKYNRTPNEKEIIAHAPLLDYEIEKVNPEIIMTLGNIGLKRLAGRNMKISDMHGTVLEQPVRCLKNLESNEYGWTEKTYKIFPTYHPASIFYNRSLLEAIHEDLDKLGELLAQIREKRD
ncbi:uracil-DNA glycosylase [Jeotgalibacillus proteolyticus]|uniref:Uracil-DNA glycosylase n=1 Tax=Jeotgalibacillus proteolyticus TaxID=2082395 RepID=A0A2S5GCN5_9BACL|nr:uracil-DNA glycosylase [Jeotgalibacillus proteolyticus]PPA70685.1 uracil-DNA glycosylase [Jeotgalibacillus proteolyticus]